MCEQGFSFLSPWGSLRYSLSACSVAAVYVARVKSDPKTPAFAAWVASQVDYALGSTGRSFLVGFGVDPPTHAHNRGESHLRDSSYSSLFLSHHSMSCRHSMLSCSRRAATSISLLPHPPGSSSSASLASSMRRRSSIRPL